MNARALILFVLLVPVFALGAWLRLRAPSVASAAEEHALIATIKLRSGDRGSTDERASIVALENQLCDAIKNET